MKNNFSLSRRQFVQSLALTTTALSLPQLPFPLALAAEKAKLRNTMQYRVLGSRTGLKISEVGFGGYAIDDPDLLSYASDLGINHVDTAPQYRDGASEENIGKAMKTLRNKFILTTKWHPRTDSKKEELIESLNQSLKRLKTDHVDCLLVHNVGKDNLGGFDRLNNPEFHEAMELAKKQGKARFFGISGHQPDLMDTMGKAIDLGKFDVLLMRYNFREYKNQQQIIKKAKTAGVGVIVMKTLSGAKKEKYVQAYRKRGATLKQASLKWVLSNPDISGLIITMKNREHVWQYARVSGREFGKKDQAALDHFNHYLAEHGSELEGESDHKIHL